MVTYKEFELLKYLLSFQGNTTVEFLTYLKQQLRYPVFQSQTEVLELIDALREKG